MRILFVAIFFLLLVSFVSADCNIDGVIRNDLVLDSKCSYGELVVSGDLLVDCNGASVGNVKIKGGDVKFKDCDFVEGGSVFTGYSVTEVESRAKPVLLMGAILGVFILLTFYKRKVLD